MRCLIRKVLRKTAVVQPVQWFGVSGVGSKIRGFGVAGLRQNHCSGCNLANVRYRRLVDAAATDA